MTSLVLKGQHEKYELRKAAWDHTCFTWSERDGAAEPQCARIIGKGEQHLVSTIYPGHESGFADGYKRGPGHFNGTEWVPGEWVYSPAPVSSRFCLPCVDRWNNLRDALEQLTQERAS
jgi:hypothetical protein